mgnify:CR=1 FL=1
MERKFVLAVVAFLNRQCTVVGHRRLRDEILIGREIGIDIVELRSGCEKCLKITHGACHGTGIQKNIPDGENAVQSPGADHKVRSEIGKERKQRVFSVCDGGEAGEVEVHRQEMFHGLSKLCVEKVIKMTDADIVRAPFFQRRIGEIIGNRVGMVVALVQLNFFLRTLAVDAGGKSQLQSAEQEQRECRKRRGKEVFHALECHFMSCSFNGIVGKSGEGKTTFINLLFRLWDIQSGEIEIDNINVKNYNINKLRENIDIVSQEVFLLNDTIKNNLTLLNENISMEKVVTIAKKVGLYDMILDSPKGFDTVVGDNGIKLSGGQKQRLSIARVLLREAQIVIFDEATSSLDNAAQENIIDLIFSLLKNRTVIIIAHRLSAVKRCDNIIVINNGRVTESGNHNELMEMQGEYYALYNAEI